MRRISILVIAAACCLAFAAGPAAGLTARTFSTNAAPLIHVGNNPATCTTVPGPRSGVVVVHLIRQRNVFDVVVVVLHAKPNTTYVVDIRCVGQIGTLTTNSRGFGHAHLRLPAGAATPPAGPFYIDLSVPPPGGAGGGGYGDTFIAGPFTIA